MTTREISFDFSGFAPGCIVTKVYIFLKIQNKKGRGAMLSNLSNACKVTITQAYFSFLVSRQVYFFIAPRISSIFLSIEPEGNLKSYFVVLCSFRPVL